MMTTPADAEMKDHVWHSNGMQSGNVVTELQQSRLGLACVADEEQGSAIGAASPRELALTGCLEGCAVAADVRFV